MAGIGCMLLGVVGKVAALAHVAEVAQMVIGVIVVKMGHGQDDH